MCVRIVDRAFHQQAVWAGGGGVGLCRTGHRSSPRCSRSACHDGTSVGKKITDLVHGGRTMITCIREIRRARGLTLLDIAERCVPPTTAQTIGRLEMGTRTVSLGWLN